MMLKSTSLPRVGPTNKDKRVLSIQRDTHYYKKNRCIAIQIRLLGVLLLLSGGSLRLILDHHSIAGLLTRAADDGNDDETSIHDVIVAIDHPRIVHWYEHNINGDGKSQVSSTTKQELEVTGNPITPQPQQTSDTAAAAAAAAGRNYFEPLEVDQSMCVPAEPWRTTQLHPSCNNIHEINVHHLKFLGSGGWRMAFSYHNDDDHVVAVVVKMLKLDQYFETLTFRRHAIDAIISDYMTSNPRVVSAYGFCGQTIVTEKAEMSLSTRIKNFKKKKKKKKQKPTTNSTKQWRGNKEQSLRKRVQYARDAAAALASVHQLHSTKNNDVALIAHHDIKPENFMFVGDDRLVLNDFNDGELLSINTTTINKDYKEECHFRRRRWSIYYKSPEDITERPLTHKSDIYSLGGVLYFLLTGGTKPYDGLDKTDAAIEIIRGHLPELPPSETILELEQQTTANIANHEKDDDDDANNNVLLHNTMVDLMNRCLAYDPKQRPSAQQVANELTNALESLDGER